MELTEHQPKKRRRKSNSDTWKAVERAIAALLGGERVPVTGRTRGYAPDIAHAELAIEVKHGKSIPKLLLTAMAQAVAARDWYARRGEGERIPLVVFHPEGARYDESLVIVRIKDLPRLRQKDTTDAP